LITDDDITIREDFKERWSIFKDNRVQALLLLKDGHEALAMLKDEEHQPTCTVRAYLQHACFFFQMRAGKQSGARQKDM
jgi:hypothetical protein